MPKKRTQKSQIKTKKTRVKHLKPHHAKPFRKRHIGLGALGVTLVAISSYVLGFGSGRLISNEEPVVVTQTPSTVSSVSVVSSSRGFSFAFDRNIFDVAGTIIEDGEARTLTNSDLGKERDIASARISPILGQVEFAESLSSLEVQVGSKASEFKTLIDDTLSQGDRATIAADLYELKSAGSATVNRLSSEVDELGGRLVVKRVYEVTERLGGTLGSGTTYTIIWSGSIGDEPFSATLSGLVGSSGVPQFYGPPLETLNFTSDAALVLNPDIIRTSNPFQFNAKAYAQSNDFDSKYLADLVSPSVVKVYLGFCGQLTILGQIVDSEYCNGATGTGFIISPDGYIATNGHVVVYEAEDYVVDTLLSSQQAFINVMSFFGFSESEAIAIANSPSSLSALIASIYDSEETDFTFSNEERAIWVALGDEPVDFDTVDAYFGNNESSTLKEAELIDIDYSAKDFYVTALEEDGGFSASDVAILKVNLDRAPSLNVATTEPTQNEAITILGFPGDAENSLVEQDEVAISVTNGSISSIRTAAGSDSKLYQSDADASQGNSGGPAINGNGEVIGLLTYRFKNETAVDASKSYIRAIEDLVDLADENNVSLNQESQTYKDWQKGLELYSENRFSKSIKEFEKVKDAYPGHRLVDTYINNAEKAIADGLDVQDFPALIAVVGLIGGLGAAATAGFLIIRHNHHHKAHVAYQVQQTGQVPQNISAYQVPQVPAQAQQFPVGQNPQPQNSPPSQQLNETIQNDQGNNGRQA